MSSKTIRQFYLPGSKRHISRAVNETGPKPDQEGNSSPNIGNPLTD